jgi:hypothetical protein
MVFQYTEGADNNQIVGLLDDPAPFVRTYLIRALKPTPYDPVLTRYLIAASRSPHPGIAAAAVDKLVEMGTHNYRVIRALLDSARAGNAYAIEPVGWIGDRRCIPDLEAIFMKEAHGPLKRSSFLALEKMGAPYIGRKEVVCARIPAPPRTRPGQRTDGFPTMDVVGHLRQPRQPGSIWGYDLRNSPFRTREYKP